MPDGTFRFIEHVERPPEGFVARLQDAITLVWCWFGAGCHPNRRTLEPIEATGFEIVQLEERLIASMPFIAGVARLK